MCAITIVPHNPAVSGIHHHYNTSISQVGRSRMQNTTATQRETIRTERVDCPICGASESNPWGSENGWHAGQCVQCSCVYVNPRPLAPGVSEAARTGLHPTQNGLQNMIESYRRG